MESANMQHKTASLICLLIMLCFAVDLSAQSTRRLAAKRRSARTPRAATSQPATSQPSSNRNHAASVQSVRPVQEVLQRARKIDQLIQNNYKKQKLRPNAPAAQDVFMRRVSLDITGRIPTYREAKRYLDKRGANKRTQLIDQLLDSPGYISHQFNQWADILRIKSNLQYAPGKPYIDWIKTKLRNNTPYDKMVSELLLSGGYVWENGAAGYYQRDVGMPLDNMSNTTQIFLGTRLVCAQCHDHPFDVWTQLEYHEMAAFTYGIATRTPRGVNSNIDTLSSLLGKEPPSKQSKSYTRQAVYNMSRSLSYYTLEVKKNLRLPHDYKYDDAKPKEVIEPATIFGDDIEVGEGESRRAKYVAWMTSPINPRFTKVIANRLWKQVFGVGLIEPVDDIRESSAASNPLLLKYLTQMMTDLNYDIKQYLRVLYNTKLYQRQASRNEYDRTKPFYFTGPLLRRMSAEQMWDSMLTLAIPDPDGRKGNQAIGNYNHIYLERLRRTPAEDLLEIAKQNGRVMYAQRQFQVKWGELQAKKKKDTSQAKAIDRQMSELRDEYNVAVAELKKQQTTQPVELSKEELRKLKDDDNYSDKKWKDYDRQLVRASELIQPAPLGHFLRQFGQSDREQIENAYYDASVPQVLTMINGPLFKLMMQKNSVLVKLVNKQKSKREKVRIIYLSILGRQPTSAESNDAVAEIKKWKNEGYANLVWAMLNTRQFAFIQ